MFEDIFRHRKADTDRLIGYGFITDQTERILKYQTDILDHMFRLTVTVDQKGAVDMSVAETETGDEYYLYRTNASGTFVGEVRKEISEVLTDISKRCFTESVFVSRQSEYITGYIRDRYGVEPEFLWPKFPDNCIWRRRDTEKWYAAMLTTKRKSLGFDSDERIELIDLRIEPDMMDDILKKDGYYPGWHMNKKHWFTIILDEGVSDEEIFRRIDDSYMLAVR